MIYRLIAKKPAPHLLILTFGWGSRVFFGALALLIAFGMVQEQSVGTFALILTIILFLAALYLDRWSFDRNAAQVAHSSGLLFLHRTKRYELSGLEEVVFHGRKPEESPEAGESMTRVHQRRASSHGVARLRLRFADAGDVDVQMEPNRHADTLRNLGLEIAGFCDVAFRDHG